MTQSKIIVPGFTKADKPPKPRLIWAGVGEPGTGKSRFALGAPGPMYIQSCNRGLEGVIEEFQKTKDIYVKEYEWSPSANNVLEQSAAIELRDRFEEDCKAIIASGARTLIWDLESEVWGIFKYAEHGFSEQGTPKDWDSLKARIRTLINLAKASDINFGMLQGMRNEWVPSTNPKTGKKGITQSGLRIRAGMDEIEGLVNVNLYHSRIKVPGEPSVFQFEVGKARGPASKDVQDQTFQFGLHHGMMPEPVEGEPEPTGLSFVDFAMLVFPDSTEGDWL